MKNSISNFTGTKGRSIFFFWVFVFLLSITSSSRPQNDTQTEYQRFLNLPGQSNTLLPDGRRLLIGGKNSVGPVASATIWDEQSQKIFTIPSGLAEPRAWHSATVLPDGQVLILGGVSSGKQVLGTAEIFDPETLSFRFVTSTVFTPRAHHTATLLPDGKVLLTGGVSNNSETLATAELWNTRSGLIQTVPGSLAQARKSHSATLGADGNIIISGGIGALGRKISNSEVYDYLSSQFIDVNTSNVANSEHEGAKLAGSLPADGDINVPTDIIVSVRFSELMRVDSINQNTVQLKAEYGLVAVKVVPAEGGRLAFITPKDPLAPNTTYALTIIGASDLKNQSLPATNVTFSTIDLKSDHRSPKDEIWTPRSMEDWRTNDRESAWRSLPPLQASSGVTALAGQVLKLNGDPLAKVTLMIGKVSSLTDETGRFLLGPLPTGWQKMLIDGKTANTPGKTYGVFEVGVKIKEGQNNILPYTIWMPLIDIANSVKISSPTTSEVVVRTPRVHGLEVRIPAGTVIRDRNGNIVKEVSITPIPLDRTPFPLPENVFVTMYFTIQPNGARLFGPQGARIIYPNHSTHRARQRFNVWRYASGDIGWHIYGMVSVTDDEREITPYSRAIEYEFAPVTIQCINGLPPDTPYDNQPGQCAEDGDPVDCQTGLFLERNIDLVIQDVLPIVLTRTYRSMDDYNRPFGKGATHSYQLFLWSDNAYQDRDLVLPDGRRIHYIRVSPGTGYEDAIFEQNNLPSVFYKSRIVWNGNGWDLTLKNGMIYVFGHNAPLQRIRDRYGNQITITRSPAITGAITKITSPNQRWIEFAYETSVGTGQINQVKDNMGRTLKYTYASDRLIKVTDPMGGVTEYTYDASYRMLTVKNPRGNFYVTNEYDANGRVFRQTRADSTTYQFAYTVVNFKVVQTDVTNPRGYIRRMTFNPDGFLLTDTYALGTPIQQTTSYERQAGTNFLLSATDPLGRKTSYAYDAMGNTTSVTFLSDTPQAVTTNFTYESTFNQLSSVTDVLNHTTSFNFDANGNPITITDPLMKITNIAYNSAGQPTSIADPLMNTMQFTYSLGDLTGVTNPLGNSITQFLDSGGRLTSANVPMEQPVRYEYDALNRPLKSIDAISGTTTFGYDANSNLLSVTDARGGITSFSYNNMDRLVSRTDPLLRSESYIYDANDNLIQGTDRKSQVSTYTYDALDRLTQVTQPGGYTTTFSYDAANRLTQVVDAMSGTITLAYDGLDRLISETTPQGVTSYTYDAVGRRASMTVSGQSAINYAYDNANRLTQITQGTSTVLITYDDSGRRTSLSLPNGIIMQYGYDTASQLTSITYKLGANVLGDLIYEYDAVGRRRKVSGSYARTNLPQALGSAAYNPANQQINFGSQTLTYDNNGNLTSDGINSYTWNSRDQLISIAGPGLTAAFQYDAFGRRKSKTINGTSTSFLYDRSTPVQELSGATPTANLLSGLGMDEFFVRTDSAGMRTLLSDALGSSIALADSSGVVQTQYTYEPFGKSTVSGSSNTNSYQYTSRENDGTGMLYYRARYYHPGLQRFIGEDPLQFGGGDFNLYAYVFNDPINSIDPTGTELVDLRGDEHEECEGEPITFDPPDLAESFIPIWGSGKQAFNDFDTGHEWWGTFNITIAATDVCMVTALGRGLLKGGWKFGNHNWKNTSRWYHRTRKLTKGQEVHHYVIERNSACGKQIPDWLKNQPWNLMPMQNRLMHDAVGGKGLMRYKQFGRMWFGTPDWYKAGVLNGTSKGANAMRKLCDCKQ